MEYDYIYVNRDSAGFYLATIEMKRARLSLYEGDDFRDLLATLYHFLAFERLPVLFEYF